MTTKNMKLVLGQNRMRLVRLRLSTRKMQRKLEAIRSEGKQPELRAVG